jgi:hypothetical protein
MGQTYQGEHTKLVKTTTARCASLNRPDCTVSQYRILFPTGTSSTNILIFVVCGSVLIEFQTSTNELFQLIC